MFAIKEKGIRKSNIKRIISFLVRPFLSSIINLIKIIKKITMHIPNSIKILSNEEK